MSWQRVRGHEALKQGFDHVVRSGRLAHAYLFAGPSGVGKRLFAGELGKALLCEAAVGAKLEACDRCLACMQVEAGTHPDFVTAGRPEDNLELPIETVRELCRALSLKPARGRWKIAILDDADDLNDASANCFLKTLEEPPPGSVLILIGTNPERQLSTIVSRCQVVWFAPLNEALVSEVLRDSEAAAPALIERLARLSGGSPGQARALADPTLWEFRRGLVERLTRPVLDTVALAHEWVHLLEDAGKEASAQRRRATLVLRLLVEFVSDALHLSVGKKPRLAEPDDLRLLRELGSRADPETLLSILDCFLEADWEIDRRVQLVLIIEALMDAVGRKMVSA
jgi:DNA polymerase-3 subunit delta'